MISGRRTRTILLVVLATAWTSAIHAADMGPFGTGLPDSGVTNLTVFPKLFGALIVLQTYFNEHLTASILALKHGGSAVWSLLAVSFLYGVVHAVGPGHGKAVLSSYILANRQTARSGVALAFLAALAQAAGAVALVVACSVILHLTSVSITHVTYKFEIGSDALVVCLGLWLVWSKIVRPLRRAWTSRALSGARTEPGAAASSNALAAGFICEEEPPQKPSKALFWRRGATRDVFVCGCGGLHLPISSLGPGTLDLKKAWSVIASTAMRPCTGSLIVLVFAMSQGVLPMGVAAALIMGLGTATTVACLALATAGTQGLTLGLAGVNGALARTVKIGFESIASLAVLAAGMLMLTANLALR